MKSKISQAAKKSVSLLLAILMMFSMLTVAMTVTVNAATAIPAGTVIYFDNTNTQFSTVALSVPQDSTNGNSTSTDQNSYYPKNDKWYQMTKVVGTDNIWTATIETASEYGKMSFWNSYDFRNYSDCWGGAVCFQAKYDGTNNQYKPTSDYVENSTRNKIKVYEKGTWSTYGSGSGDDEGTVLYYAGTFPNGTTTAYFGSYDGSDAYYTNVENTGKTYNGYTVYKTTNVTGGNYTHIYFDNDYDSSNGTTSRFQDIGTTTTNYNGQLYYFPDGTKDTGSWVSSWNYDETTETTAPTTTVPVDPAITAPKLKGDTFVIPGGEVTFTLDNQKDFGTAQTLEGNKTGKYLLTEGVSLAFEVTADSTDTHTSAPASSGKLLTTDGSANYNDAVKITAGKTEGVTYTVKVTASKDGYTPSSATATVKVATIPNKLPDRIYAYAAPLADGALPTAYNAWAASETAAPAQQVYRNNGDAEKIPGLGATTDTNIRIFLPTTASSTDVVLYNAFATKITVGGTEIEAGKYAKVSYTPNTEMTVSFADSRASKNLTIYKSEAQGALYINHTGEFAGTNGNNVLKMLEKLYSGKEEGEIAANNAGAVVDNQGKVANVTVKKIKGRGNSTWRSTDKKSFNVNFDENLGGKYINSNFKGKKYSLLANFKDPSLSRNKILYALGDYMGAKYSPDVATIDLYMNGMYMGNYLMTQKVDIGSKDLVNDLDEKTLIEEKYGDFATALTKTDEIAANGFSFMLELDTNAGNGDFHFDVNHGGFNQTLTIKEPEYLKKDGSMPSDALVTTIEKFIGDKYKALIDALKGTDSAKLAEIIDIPSLARYMMLNELAKNYDIGVSSTYFVYNNTAQKFYISPVWDLDVTTGNCKETETGYQSYEGDWLNSNNELNKVMRLVFANEQVINEVKSFWTEDFYTALCTEIDRLTANAKTDAKGSFENNYVKWSYPNGFQGEYNDDVQFKTSLTTATYTAGGTYNNKASTVNYDKNSYSQTQFVGDWLKSRAAWLTKKYATPSTPVESNWRIEYWDSTAEAHKYIAPTSVAADGTATWETNFNFGSFATDGKFRITNGETWTNGSESTFCVPAYKRTNQKGTETYVTVTAAGAGVVTNSNDFGSSDAGSYGVSKYNDIKLTGIDTSKTYVVTYKPGTGNALDGQIKIADKDTIVVTEPKVSITGTKLTNENIVLGTPITITATVTPLKENDVVVEGEYTVTLYRGSSVVKTDKITFTATDEQKVYTFNTELNSNDESYKVEVTKDTYSATSNTVAYKQTGVKDIKIYFDPSEIWLSALTINSTVTATAGGKTFTMSIDPGDDNALAKGVFRAMIDSKTLEAIKTSGVSFKLDNSTKEAITATADASANVSDGDIYTYDSKNGSKWCSYNKTVKPAYPGGCKTYEQFVAYLKQQVENSKDSDNTNDDNIVYFDNSASKWYNVYIYDWNSEEGKNAQPLTKLPYADIWYYDFGDTMHTLDFLFKDRSTNAYGTDYQQTVDLVGHIDQKDKYVNNANGDQVYLNFENTVNTPNPIFITANFYKCTIKNPTGTDVTGYKYRAFNTEWKEFAAVIDAQVKTKAVTVYFDIHKKDVADVQLYHSSTDASYTFASTFTRLTPLPGSTIYSATMQLPYKVVDGAVTPVFTFDKFIIGTDTTEYPMSSAVQPKGDCFTTGEVWYEYNGTTPPNGKSVVSTSANAKTLVATGANVSIVDTGYSMSGATVYFQKPSGWNNVRMAVGRSSKRQMFAPTSNEGDIYKFENISFTDYDGFFFIDVSWSCNIEDNNYYDWHAESTKVTDKIQDNNPNNILYKVTSGSSGAVTSEEYTGGSSSGTTTTIYIDKSIGYSQLYVWSYDSNGQNKVEPLGSYIQSISGTDKEIGTKTYTVVSFDLNSGYTTFNLIANGTTPGKSGDITGFTAGETYTITSKLSTSDTAVSSESGVTTGAPVAPPTIDRFTVDNDTITLSGDPASATTTLTIQTSNATGKTVTYTVTKDAASTADATVSADGKTFTATKAGTYQVTARLEGASETKSVTITVNAPAVVDVTTFYFRTDLKIAGSTVSHIYARDYDNQSNRFFNGWPGTSLQTLLEQGKASKQTIDGVEYWVVTISSTGVTTIDFVLDAGDNSHQSPNTQRAAGGTYTISNTSIDNQGALTIVDGAPVATEYSVTLDNTSLSLDLNGTTSATLKATTKGFTQSATVTWNSDNEAVAKVVNGVVTAVGVGTATITVTYQEGGNTKTATCNVTVTNSSVPTVDYCGILGYTHSTATFESTTGGSITDAYVELTNGYYQDAAYKTGYAITTDGVTTVIYAIPTEKTGATTVYKSTTTGDTGYLFNEWTKDGAFLTSVQDLTTANVTTTNTVSYVANWSQVQKVQYTFTYKYWDQDKSKGMEYNPQNLIEKEYVVTVMLDENPTDDVIKAAFRANAPKLSSDYYSYSFDSVDVAVSGTTASATAAKTVKEYSVTIRDNDGQQTTLNTKYNYQNLVTLTAQGTLATGYRFVWKYAGTDSVIGYGNSISIRITDDLAVEYMQEKTATTSPDYTILHKPTYEFFTSGNVEKVRFNFLVENTVVDKDNFAEFGILYFFTDEKGVNSNVYADANVPTDTLTDIVLGNTKLADVKVKKIERFNFKNEYIFNAAMTNSDANLEKYVRVYSYIKFKDGRVVLSDTTTPVLGSLKEARLA